MKELDRAVREVELNLKKDISQEKCSINMSKDLKPFFCDMYHCEYEKIKFILLDNSNKVLDYLVYEGDTFHCMVPFKRLFKHIALCMARSIIMIHNHPSGSDSFSYADMEVKKKLEKAGEYLDFKVLDSIIVFDNKFKSQGE